MRVGAPATVRAVYEVGHLPGVTRCEAFRTLPVRLRSGQVETGAASAVA